MATPLSVTLALALRGRTYIFEGVWAAGTYAQLSVVSHTNAFWYALRSTAVEPSDAATADWEILIDLRDATSDAEAAAAAAAVSAALADADRIQTGLDRAATAADVIAAEADRVAAAASAASADADATATAADALATAADRVQTTADAAASNASRLLAEGAETNAETAQTGTQALYDLGVVLLASVSAIALTVAMYATLAQTAQASATAVTQTTLGASQRSIEYSTTKVVNGSCSISALREMWNFEPRLGPVGDWRDKVSGVSWMLESLGTSTRGSQARFPSNGDVSITTTLLTIANQDGVTGDLWKTFVIAGGAGVAYSQGNLYYFGTGGLYCIDFIADRVYRWDTTGKSICNNQTVATYNQGTATWSIVATAQAVASASVSSVAAMVGPLTPINPARAGLPNPTLAFSPSGSTTIIRHDGLKSTIAATFLEMGLDAYGLWGVTTSVYRYFGWAKIMSGGAAMAADYDLATTLGITEPFTSSAPYALGSATRLRRFMIDRGSPACSLHADINSTYNTGWNYGAQKVTIAESSALLSTPSSAELLTNGAFTTDLTGWTDNDVGTGVSAWDAGSGGRVALPRPDGTNYARISQSFATVIGQAYKLTITTSGTGTVATQVGPTSVGATGNLNVNHVAASTATYYFTATATTTVLTLSGAANGTSPYVDDVSITGNVIADRSYTAVAGIANSLVITGTLTRAVVASGAELAMVQGFSAANYGRAAYAANLGFGTSDFIAHQTVVHGATATAAQETLWDFANPSGGGAYYRLETNASGYGQFVISDGTNTATATGSKAIPANSVAKVVGVRRTASSRIEVWVFVNGELYDSAVASASAVTLTLSNASAVLAWGARADTTLPFDTASIGFTLGGVSPVAPLPDFIRKAAYDEHQMHQANTKVLLQGGTAINSMAYDETSDTLYVAKTTGGTDRFLGMVNLGALLGSGGANVAVGSAFLDSWGLTQTRATLGARASAGPTSWGNDVYSWAISEDATAASTHFVQTPNITLTAASYVFAVPIKAGTRSWAALQGSVGSPTLYCNLGSGANGTASGGATALTPVSMGSGWYLFQFAFTGTAAAWAMRVFAAEADSDNTMNGDGGASPAILIGKPILRLGSAALTAADYVYPLSGSDVHRAVAANDNGVTIATATGVDQFLPSMALRDKLSNSRRRKVYDPNKAEFFGFTTDATPTAIAQIPVSEGKSIDFKVSASGRQYGGVFTERGRYAFEGTVGRDFGGNAVVDSADNMTPPETTGSMGSSAAANTTAQTGQISVTGKNATRMFWRAIVEIGDSGHGLAA